MRDSRKLRYYTQRNLLGRRNKLLDWFSKLSITGWLIFLNIVFFIIAYPLILFYENSINYIAIQPINFFSGYYLWTLVTSMFMHGGIFHLLINMFVLFSLGSLCEKIIGRKRYLWFYLISGIVAGLLFVFLAYFFGGSELGTKIFGSPETFAVGASGAIFAIAGLFMILTPKLRFSIIFLPFFSLPAYIMIPFVLFGTWLVSVSAGWGVGNTAHLGGFLAGVVYGLYLRQKYKRKTKMIEQYFSR